MEQAKTCSPTCESFKCAKASVVYGKDSTWCRWTDEICDVANCTYAMCVKRRLLPRGTCGETIKRKTIEKPPEEVIGPTIKLKGKAYRKLGEKEIF